MPVRIGFLVSTVFLVIDPLLLRLMVLVMSGAGGFTGVGGLYICIYQLCSCPFLYQISALPMDLEITGLEGE